MAGELLSGVEVSWGLGGAGVAVGAGPHPASVIPTDPTTTTSTSSVPALLPFFLLPKTSAMTPSGPTIAPIGFHGTYGLGLFGYTSRVRNLPVEGSHLHLR